MRISDWSSDVCSSDLATKLRSRPAKRAGVGLAPVEAFSRLTGLDSRLLAMMAALVVIWIVLDLWTGGLFLTPRSEEHTSELQSLMRISYAVFCLKKKKKKNTNKHANIHKREN